MAKTKNITDPDTQLCVSLAAIAYLQGATQSETFTLMAKALQQPDLPTNQEWGLVWGPVTYESDLMYIAQGPKTKYGRRYAVVIRGTVLKVTSILQDFKLSLVDLPWYAPDAPPGTKIASGIAEAFIRLTSMRQLFPSGYLSALEFLKQQPGRNEVLVTGHSLGGCLASVMPLYLKQQLGSSFVVNPYTFAGQSAGNQAFATYFQTTFKKNIRFYNTLDVVPKLWNYNSLESIKSLYVNGPKCSDFIKGLIDIAEYKVDNLYFQPANGTPLTGKVYDVNGWFPFEKEIEDQHNHIYYMYLTGIPLKVIQGTPFRPGLGAGWWPPRK